MGNAMHNQSVSSRKGVRRIMLKKASRPIPFIDLKSQRNKISREIDKAINNVLNHGIFIMGPEVQEVEKKIATMSDVRFCLTCGSGTDALTLPLMAAEIGPGDAVFVPSFTFTSSAEAIALQGAIPFFVDINPRTFNIDSKSLESAIDTAKKLNIKAKAIMTVDLFGQPADFDAIQEIALFNDLWILDDAAQSLGAYYKDKPIGSFGRVTATSFYPSKPLGCYGDGGAVLTNDEDLYEKMRLMRVHGSGGENIHAKHLGLTARFDSIQAAVLLEKIKIFEEECDKREVIAKLYTESLKDYVDTPVILDDAKSVWAHYTIISEKRNEIVKYLAECEIPTAIFYQHPLHLQSPYSTYPIARDGLNMTEQLAKKVLSIPIHPYLSKNTQEYIISAIISALKN